MSTWRRSGSVILVSFAVALIAVPRATAQTWVDNVLNNLSGHLVSCPFAGLCTITPSTPSSGGMTCPAGATCCAPGSTCIISGFGYSVIQSAPQDQVLWTFYTDEAGTTTYDQVVSASVGGKQSFTDWKRLDVQEAPVVHLSTNMTATAEHGGVITITALWSGPPPPTDATVWIRFLPGGTATLTEPVTGTPAPGDDLTFTAPSKYIDLPGVEDWVYAITVPAGQDSGWLDVRSVDDTTWEHDEEIPFEIYECTSAVINNPPTPLSIGIIDDDRMVTLSATPGSIGENGGVATVTATVDHVVEWPVTVRLGFSGTAGASDYTVSADYIFIPRGATSRSITISAVDDGVDEADETVVVDITSVDHATEDGTQQATVTIVDDDPLPSVELALSPDAIAEHGGSATLTATLGVVSGRDVSVDLGLAGTATSGTDYTISAMSIPIPAGSLSGHVTISAVDDELAEGDETVSVSATATTATITTALPLTLSITDDDAVGVVVTPTSGLVTTEAGGTATFTVVLASQPTGNVVIDVASKDTGEGTAAPAQLVFTNANWNTPRTVTLTGVDDAIDDGDQAYTVALTMNATTADPAYKALDPADVSATNTDDDAVGVVVTPTSGLTTTEAGGTATFTVVLASQPTGNVVIDVASKDTGEGTAAPAQLVFTNANWNTPRTVTLTGVDDAIDDGDQAYTVALTMNATTADPAYKALDPADVSATNTDDDAVGVVVTPTSGLTTTEAGGTATFTVVLASQPTGNVVIDVASKDSGEGTAAPAQLTFTGGPAGTWATPRTVTLTGVDDAIDDGDQAYTVALTMNATTADPAYKALDPADVSATNTDDDAVGVVVTPTSGLTTTEAGGTATFTVVLASQPTGNVVIDVASKDTGEGTAAPAQLVFTNANWSTPRTVTLTGVDDAIDDGDQAYTVALTMNATTADPAYKALDPADVSATNTDDDAVGVVVTPTSGLVTTEAGGTATFTVVLASQPTGNVVIDVASKDTGEGTAAPAQLTFTGGPAGTWATPRTVTLTGVDDAIDDGDQAYTVALTMNATTADPAYKALDPADVSATNTDDDAVGVVVTPTSGLVTTEAGGTATFTVVLASQPTGNVVIDVASKDTGEGTAAPAQLVFTNANWNTPRTVTLTGVDDAIDDGDQAYTVALTMNATTADPAYKALDPADVSATNTDDDAVGVVVTPTSGLTTTEAGGTATFTVVLASQPTGNVVIDVASKDTGEGTAAPAQLVFTNANWNTPRTVTLTGVDDAIDDGDQAYTVALTMNATTADPAYKALDPADVSATNTDDDAVGVVVTPTSGLTTTEAGGTATFTVVLASQPTGNVVIDVASKDTGEGTAAPAQLVFTNANWNTPRTVTLTGVDDAIDDGDQAYTVALTMNATTADPAYKALDPADVSATNTDDDAASLAFATQPSTTAARQAVAPAVTVQVLDIQGRPATGSTASITLALGANPGGGTLAGTLTVAAIGGVATVADLSIDHHGSGYTLVATSADLAAAESNPFEITVSAITIFSGQSATGTGTVTVSFTGGGSDCTFLDAALLGQPPGEDPLPPVAPPGLEFPHGLLRFEIGGCQPGAELTFTITYPERLPAQARYWKYGPQGPGAAPAWYELPASINGHTVTFTMIDGGIGDSDGLRDGALSDPGGSAYDPSQPVEVGTLSEWGLILLAMALAAVGLRRLSG